MCVYARVRDRDRERGGRERKTMGGILRENGTSDAMTGLRLPIATVVVTQIQTKASFKN